MVVALSLFADVFVSSLLMPGHAACLARCPMHCQAIGAHDNATVHDQGPSGDNATVHDIGHRPSGIEHRLTSGVGCHDTATIWFSLIVVLRVWRVFRIVHAVAEVSRTPHAARRWSHEHLQKAQTVIAGWAGWPRG